MKLSVAIAADDAPASAFVVWRGFAPSIEKASRLGFHGVELALRSPDEISVAALDTALHENSIEVSAISTGQVYAVDGLSLTDSDNTVRGQTIRRIKELIDFAADFGNFVNLGRARGTYTTGIANAVVERWFVDAAKEIGEYATKKSVQILIEPINRYESDFINSVDDGSRLIEAIGSPAFGLMPDVFHMNIEDSSIEDSFRRNARFIRYVHLADSNRRAPGQGHLDFDMVFGALSDSGFDGWAAAEILPLPDPDTAAKQAAEYLLPRISAYRPGVPAELAVNTTGLHS